MSFDYALGLDYDDQQFSHVATPGEANLEYARNAGEDRPDQAWISTPFDSWERNPHYTGPAVPHPEYSDYLADLADYQLSLPVREFAQLYVWGCHSTRKTASKPAADGDILF